MKKPYPKYKTSSIPWIDSIPEHWEIEKAKWIFQKMQRPIRETDDIVTAFRDGEVTLRKNRRADGYTIALQEHGYQGVRKNDLVIHGMDAFAGAIGVSDSDGKSTPVYSVCTLKNNSFSIWYFCHAIREMSRSGFIQSLAKGIRERSTDFRFDTFRELELPLPPSEEQTQIANFLDAKCKLIDTAIEKKTLLIEKLKEKKQAVINKAVTKGIDPNAPMKDSGIDWLGKIPAHWEVKKLKYLINGKLKYGANESGEPYNSIKLRYIRITDFGNDGEIKNDSKLSLSHDVGRNYLLTEGDILFARSGGTVGKTFQCKDLSEPSCYAGYLIKAEPNSKIISSDFLYNFTKSSVYEAWKNSIFNKATIENIGADKYSHLWITLPTASEQKEICFFIFQKSDEINSAISKVFSEIELLKEYKTSLIAEAVTGKIDVRDVAVDEQIEALAIAAEPQAKYNVNS